MPGVAKYHPAAVDQMPAGGIVNAAVVVQVMEKSAGGIDRAGMEEGDVTPHPVAQEFGITIVGRGRSWSHVGIFIGAWLLAARH